MNSSIYSNCNNITSHGLFYLTISNYLLKISPWLILIIGTITNIITILVLTSKKIQKSSTFYYLTYLSIIDLTLIYTFCSNFILLYNFNIDLQLINVITCKLYAFLVYFLPQYSAWTCAFVSLDRVVSVLFAVNSRYSHLARKWNTPKTARNVLIILGIFLSSLNLQFFFYSNKYRLNNIKNTISDINFIYCSPENHPKYLSYYHNYWVYIDLSINVLIPFTIMIISSLIIIIRVRKASSRIQRQKQRNSTISFSSPSFVGLTLRKISSAHQQSKTMNISIMLAINNFAFISLTLPIVVYLSVATPLNKLNCLDDQIKNRFLKIIFILLMLLNCTINMFIYVFMSSEFKREFLEIFLKFYRK